MPLTMASMVTALITPLIPGAGPPPTTMPSFPVDFAMSIRISQTNNNRILMKRDTMYNINLELLSGFDYGSNLEKTMNLKINF
jgi:hypothetical protein